MRGGARGRPAAGGSALLPPNEGAGLPRLLHIGNRLHPDDALSGDTGAVRSLHAVHTGRDGMDGTSVASVLLQETNSMSDDSSNTTDRRGFVGAVATLGAGLALPSDARVRRLFAAQQPSDAWLDHLKGKHRQLFDVPEPEGGTALRHLRNYLDAWRNAFGVEDRDGSVVGP